MEKYDNNKDYFTPYHWVIKENDFFYSGVMYFGYLKIISEIITQLNLNGKSHLDVGCGDGRGTSYFHTNNNLISKGIDLSDRAISFAKLMNEGNNIQFSTENLFDIDTKYDLITAVEVLEHIEINVIEDFTKKIYETVNDCGYFIFSVPSVNIPTSLHRGHVQHFNKENLVSLLKNAGFTQVETLFQHNMNFSFFLTKNPIVKIIYSLIKNRYYTLNALQGLLSRAYYMRWNRCEDEHNAARIICIAKK